MYKNGYFVKQNYKKAFDLYYKAAQMNHPNAQNNLALMYINGFGVAQSYNEAFLWFSKAAKNNDAESLYNLSILYKYGMGVDKNETLAQHNKQKAFEAGYNKDK
jgi:TPR repeat protein